MGKRKSTARGGAACIGVAAAFVNFFYKEDPVNAAGDEKKGNRFSSGAWG
ncbi:hypothetical protein [Silvibacterium acidisoli]